MNLIKLKDNDDIVLLSNFTTISQYYIDNTLIIDDLNLSISKDMDKIYWEQRQNGKYKEFQKCLRHYVFALVNGEYCITTFGMKIFEILKNTKQYEILKVKIKNTWGFPNYEDSYLTGIIEKDIDINYFNNRNINVLAPIENLKWTNEKKFNILYRYFEKNNMDISMLSQFKIKLRSNKLKKILIIE